MRYLLLAVALSLTLAGCGGESESEATAPTTAPSSSAPALTAAETDYLMALREGTLLGDYSGEELVALGNAFCADLREGVDPFTRGESTGEGSWVFEQVSEPVLAMDAIGVDFEARKHLCPDAR